MTGEYLEEGKRTSYPWSSETTGRARVSTRRASGSGPSSWVRSSGSWPCLPAIPAAVASRGPTAGPHRRMVTLAGEVEVRRRRYRCGARGGEFVPLDEALGLGLRSQHTPDVREPALWLATELSDARTARTLEELCGLAVSHGQVHRWVARCGSAPTARWSTTEGAGPTRRSSWGLVFRGIERIGRDHRRLLERHYDSRFACRSQKQARNWDAASEEH